MGAFTNDKKLTRLSKVLIIVGSILLCLVLAGIIAYQVMKAQVYDNSIPIVSRPDEEQSYAEGDEVPIYETVDIDEDVINILVVGTDARDPEAERGRSDTLMLLSYNRVTKRATMSSFLRDSWVPIEGHGSSKINHAHAWGGTGLTINTLNDNFGLDIEHYVVVNFDNLINLVDDIGGIDITVTEQEAAYYRKNSGLNLEPGLNTVNGEQALIHARNRKLDSDFGRTRRQRDIMSAIFRKVKQNPSPQTITKLIMTCMSEVKTNMKPEELFTIATEIMDNKEMEIKQVVIPADGTWSYGTIQGMSVIELDIEKNRQLLHQEIYR